MTDSFSQKPIRKEIPASVPGDEGFDLNPDFIDEILTALDEQQTEHVLEQVIGLHYADAAVLIERLPSEQRNHLLKILQPSFNPEILPELDAAIREEVLELFGYADFAALVAVLDSDDAVYLIDMLDSEERDKVMARLPAEERQVIEQALAFPDYSAGRIMQRELVAVPGYWTVGEAVDYLRTAANMPDDFHALFVVDPRHRPLGTVRLSALLKVRRTVLLRDLMSTEMKVIPTAMDQEDIALLFRQRDLLAAPVVDASGRLVGCITVDDVVDVIDEEAEDDMLRLAGLSETSLYSAAMDTARSRFTWLVVNLGTAVLASLVIGMFEATIEKIVALAVLMPIVASMGGNAGTQTLTVAVRGLAMKDLVPENARRVLWKEVLVGLLNGLAFAVMVGLVAWLWFDDGRLGVVIAAAMVINMVCAGLFGIAIPLVLERFKVDPAVSSTVFLTTVTDVVGFFSFLGLASLFLL
ncbi:magnesium transporter [Insolitispirillum peregrinum]|uniref:Magnesium transporter MgtE n=1 Tax=Insolitispirillum peregrinum TaxID=80876 RepID=A0A1N7LVY3_9PROT|nr:magnesium transporter [Insolitispirillum peregrinum]SIS77977.1 magnesium transporter [Insolitispirillum peregrinum]